jgi:HEAT repeat protein
MPRTANKVVLAAACLGMALGHAARPEQPAARPESRKLLREGKPAERLAAALARARKHDMEAIPVLIDLLAELPPAQRRPAEEFLRELAGAWAPNVGLAGDDDVSRRIRRDAWASWWRRTDGPTLLSEFRKRTPSAADLERIGALIGRLGDKSFRVREQAAAELVSYGAVVVPLLREAVKGADLEKRRRGERCIETIARSASRPLPPVAARLLALRHPEGAVEALLGFLPWAEDERLAGEVQTALTTLAGRPGKADPALVRALGDSLPVRRAVAAEVLAGLGDAAPLPALRKLLKDPDPAVRLCVAVALVHARDREAVPVLIDLAADLPGGRAWQAEDILRRLAGPRAPQAGPAGDAAAHKEYRAAWHAWWKQHGTTADLARLAAAPLRKARVRARASNSWDQYTPDKAFAGGTWNAGGYAPQWLEADLGVSTELAGILLLVNQLPAGDTAHEVWVSHEPIGEDRTRAKLAHTFRGNTDANQRLRFDFPKGVFARFVQVRTTQSPSWVAWSEVELRVGRARFAFPREAP